MKKIRVPSSHDAHRPVGGTLRQMRIQEGLPEIEDLEAEIEEYMDVLLGRVDPPVDAGVLTLMEVADIYFARACEIQYMILKAERDGLVFSGSKMNKFRTGQLRSFIELTKRAAELGSRRLTRDRLEFDMARELMDLP